jgi:hypothetical protein
LHRKIFFATFTKSSEAEAGSAGEQPVRISLAADENINKGVLLNALLDIFGSPYA